jgi:hypothetical protein
VHESLPNTIDYIEIPSLDLAATKTFFAALFGWSFVDYGPDYASFDDGRMTGGFFASEKTASVSAGAPLIVFYRSELEKISARVVDLGEKSSATFLSFLVDVASIFASPACRVLPLKSGGAAEILC